MAQHDCQAMRRWLADEAGERLATPSATLVTHVAACPICRGLLTTLAAELMAVSAPPEQVSCAGCERDLDAYIDYAERFGPAEAARRYPQVWWHLWTCADCAELHVAITAMLSAEAAGELGPMPTVRRPLAAALPKLQLGRAYLHALLAPQADVGLRWGPADGSQIGETASGPFQLTLLLHTDDPEHWTLVVQLEPPVAGAAVVHLGASSWRAALGPDGTASIGGVPPRLLAERAGPDLLVTIEADEATI